VGVGVGVGGRRAMVTVMVTVTASPARGGGGGCARWHVGWASWRRGGGRPRLAPRIYSGRGRHCGEHTPR